MSEQTELTKDIKLELQLGDIINITAPVNQRLNEKTFIIDYIDKTHAYLIDIETFDRIFVNISEEGIIDDGNITRISILSRNESPSYAIQNGLMPNTWVNIRFDDGDVPFILVGEITNLEEDMIELTTLDKDVIYINFDYKGIPEELPIQLIEIREKPMNIIQEPQEVGEAGEVGEVGEAGEAGEVGEAEEAGQVREAEKELSNEQFPELEPEREEFIIPVKNVRDQLKEFILRADEIEFGGEELGPITQQVNVSSKYQRYSLETQVTDLLDDLLSTIPNNKRTPSVLNNIHTMIERFKQLRKHFSTFDQYGNVEKEVTKGANYKSLTHYFNDFNINLYWILPVIKNIKKIYADDIDIVEEESSYILPIDLKENIQQINEIIKAYKSNTMSEEQNNFTTLYSALTPLFTPFELTTRENTEILIEKDVNTNINTIVDNLDEMYCKTFSNKSLMNRRFVIDKYNTSLDKLETVDATSSRLITKRVNITENDTMSIKSLLTLPEPVIRFSKINLPGTSILDKANLNLHFFNYWQFLKTNTRVQPIMVSNLDNEIEYEDTNFANNTKNFVLDISLSEKSTFANRVERYQKFVEMIVPKTRVLFNLMKKYITGKLSIVNVVSYLEPFLIYSDDLTYMQYKEITQFIDEKIREHNKRFIERERIFDRLKPVNDKKMPKSRSIIEIINKDYQYSVFSEGYDFIEPEKKFTNSEIIRKIIMNNYSKLYTTAISLQSAPLMFPSEFSSLFDEEKNKLNDKILKQNSEEKCKTYTIAKYYKNVENLYADNGTPIYFDKKYDKTNYGVIEESYAKEVVSMPPEEFQIYLMNELMNRKKLDQEDAMYLAETLVQGYKKVIDGQFAILYKGYNAKFTDQIEYYVRKDDMWILDEELQKINDDIKLNTDDSSILCNLQEECMNTSNDKCESISGNELVIQSKLLKDVINEFDSKYKISKEDFEKNVDEKYKYLLSLIAPLHKIEVSKIFKYNTQKYKLGMGISENTHLKPECPYTHLLNMILGQDDFVKIQTDIIKFKNSFTREAVDGIGPLNEMEDIHWLYCIESNVPILPSFKFKLAEAYVTSGQTGYRELMERLISDIGKKSDDGDITCDKYSGWIISQSDLVFEEEYDDSGFKVSSRAVMEKDASDLILEEANIKYKDPRVIMIVNIVNTIAFAMSINIETQKEFIINGTMGSIDKTTMSQTSYEKKEREMANKGKRVSSYKDYFNSALMYYTLGMFLIAVQTSIPSIKTRKTHPGCVRSFSGYPFEGAGDLSSLTYLACIVFDIKDSVEPWNILKKKKIEDIRDKIRNSIDEILKDIPEVQMKVREKTAYLLTDFETEIPQEHDIANWNEFLPPLNPFKMKSIENISAAFSSSLKIDLKGGLKDQREKLLVIESKIIQFSLGIIEKVQEIVQKKKLLLHSANNEYFIENACCHGEENESTIQYFYRQNRTISEYNEIVRNLSDTIDDIKNGISKSGMFLSPFNTKNSYPIVKNEFSEKTIYLAFIRFCKFKSLMPIPENLRVLCEDKPAIQMSDSTQLIIQKLKQERRNYSLDDFLRLLQIISQNNTITIQFEPPELSYNTKLINLLDKLASDEEPIMKESDETKLRYLIKNALDTFEIASDQKIDEVKELDDFLIEKTDSMKDGLIEFIQINKGRNPPKIIKRTIEIIRNLSMWNSMKEYGEKTDENLYNIVNFYKIFVSNFVDIFPNIILNKVDYSDVFIPKYYGFSSSHTKKLEAKIEKYYEKFNQFHDNFVLKNILVSIQQLSHNLVLMTNNTPCFTSIHLGEKIIKPIFDEITSKFIFEYYLLKVLINYVDLTYDSTMIVSSSKPIEEEPDLVALDFIDDLNSKREIPKSRQMLRGDQQELKTTMVDLLIVLIDIMDKEKEIVDITYDQIKDRIFKLKEREKDMFTDRLKQMTDESRDVDTMLKINNLGMYSKALQKGLTVYDKEFYDEEEELRDELTKFDRKIQKKKTIDEAEEFSDDEDFGADGDYEVEDGDYEDYADEDDNDNIQQIDVERNEYERAYAAGEIEFVPDYEEDD